MRQILAVVLDLAQVGYHTALRLAPTPPVSGFSPNERADLHCVDARVGEPAVTTICTAALRLEPMNTSLDSPVVAAAAALPSIDTVDPVAAVAVIFTNP